MDFVVLYAEETGWNVVLSFLQDRKNNINNDINNFIKYNLKFYICYYHIRLF